MVRRRHLRSGFNRSVSFAAILVTLRALGHFVTLPARHLGSQTELWKFANFRWQKPATVVNCRLRQGSPTLQPPWIHPRAVRRQIAYLYPRVKIPVGFNLKPKVVFVCLQSTGPPSGPRDTPVSAARELCSLLALWIIRL